MANAQTVLRVLRDASIHYRATRGRRGAVIYLEDAEDVVVAGDLHGNVANFKKALRLADLDRHPTRHLVLQELVHGRERYPGGGCTSHQLLDLAAALKCQHQHRVHVILGNHELAEWTGREIGKDGESLNELFARGVEEAYGEQAEAVTAAYHELFKSMPLVVRTLNRVFISHSIPTRRAQKTFDPKMLDSWFIPEDQRGRGSDAYELLWGRDVDEETSRTFAELVDADLFVTGHIKLETGFSAPNSRQVIVDCTAEPSACAVFPAESPLTHADLVAKIVLIA